MLSIYDAQVHEGDGHVDLRVELNQPADQLVSVMYRAVAGDAEAGLDYEDSGGIVLFAPGGTKGKIRLDILEDEIPEPDETFTVVLNNARHAAIARGIGRVTIVDDQAGATVWIDDEVAFEEDGAWLSLRCICRSRVRSRVTRQLSDREWNGDRRRGL